MQILSNFFKRSLTLKRCVNYTNYACKCIENLVSVCQFYRYYNYREYKLSVVTNLLNFNIVINPYVFCTLSDMTEHAKRE